MNTMQKFILLAVIASFLGAGCGKPEANTRWFEDQSYNYQTRRTLGEGLYGGSEAGEVLAAISGVREGDDEAWYQGWHRVAAMVESRAQTLNDPVSKGRAMLRAANYYRTAEFLLHPRDKRREPTFQKSVANFYEGLKYLRIKHSILTVLYESRQLKAVYYPGSKGSNQKPLIVACGGYDSTQEEIYFTIVAAALDRGYSVLTFAGPGQGAAIREQGLLFTPEWEKPTGAVLDTFIAIYGKPKKIVFIGTSLGGYLAPRAAAYDKRIDGVVAFNVCYDFQEAAMRQAPGIVKTLHRMGFNGLIDRLLRLRMKFSPGVRWGVHNAEWTMGAKSPSDLLSIFEQYNLKDESKLITCDVLITAGEEDHFFPVEQVEAFQSALVNARSVTTRVFTKEEGGHEHCQQGAFSLFHECLFDWIEKTF